MIHWGTPEDVELVVLEEMVKHPRQYCFIMFSTVSLTIAVNVDERSCFSHFCFMLVMMYQINVLAVMYANVHDTVVIAHDCNNYILIYSDFSLWVICFLFKYSVPSLLNLINII